jgi:hypothetical protein
MKAEKELAELSYQKDRLKFAPDDRFLEITDLILDFNKNHELALTVKLNGPIATFRSDNKHWFGEFMLKITQQKNKSKKFCVVIVIRKQEPGPVEPRSKNPYDSIAIIQYQQIQKNKGIWFETDPESLKKAYRIDNKTGKPIEPETNLLYCLASEIIPNITSKGIWEICHLD